MFHNPNTFYGSQAVRINEVWLLTAEIYDLYIVLATFTGREHWQGKENIMLKEIH